LGIKTAVLIGGDPMGKQIHALRAIPRIIIATPGRLIDHLQQKNIEAQYAHIVVIDEADRMLDMALPPRLKMCCASACGPPDHAVSATMLKKSLQSPKRI